jgi:cold shock CspA family protein
MNTGQTMFTGTVKRWVGDRGFGFIEIDGDLGEIFVHVTEVAGKFELKVGERVRFWEGTSPRTGKLQARNVELISRDRGLTGAAVASNATLNDGDENVGSASDN